jgi:hypothetical protein
MHLIFTDDSGSAFGSLLDFAYRDGDHFCYGGIPISPLKYSELEHLFSALVSGMLGIESRFDGEVHAGEIFHRKGRFASLTDADVETFFSTVVQLLSKFDVPLLVGFQLKRGLDFPARPSRAEKLQISATSIAGFLFLVERYLAEKNSRGLVVADEFERGAGYLDFRKQKNLFTCKGNPNFSAVLRRIFYDMQKWRVDPRGDVPPLLKVKYALENRAAFLIDNIHYVNSQTSPMTQFVDCMVFLFSRIIQKFRLASSTLFNASDYVIPLNRESWGMFLSSTMIARYVKNDFLMIRGTDLFNVDAFMRILKGYDVNAATARAAYDDTFIKAHFD